MRPCLKNKLIKYIYIYIWCLSIVTPTTTCLVLSNNSNKYSGHRQYSYYPAHCPLSQQKYLGAIVCPVFPSTKGLIKEEYFSPGIWGQLRLALNSLCRPVWALNLWSCLSFPNGFDNQPMQPGQPQIITLGLIRRQYAHKTHVLRFLASSRIKWGRF